GSILWAVEAGRAGDAHTGHLIVALFRWLTGVRGVADLPGGADALEAADDVDAVGATATRIPLKTFVDVFAAQVGVAVQANRTDALYAGGAFQTDGPTATGDIFTARYGRTGAVRISAGAAVADALVGRRVGAVA